MSVVNKVTIKGFKSFANKTEFLFGKGFNTIIGPNGSGKSNLCDAMCFVLGKSSAKEMRAERSSHLIYNGGKKKNPAKEAEVIIEFNNREKRFPLDTDKVEISRVVKQNGTSVYTINGETHTRQQVVDVLRSAKIDPDGHNIILQGDVIGFMELKPVERRLVIEEIAGIAAYDERKHKAMNELEKVDGRLNEAEIILKERESNLRELKKERDQAIRYKEIQETITDDKATLAHFILKEKKEKVTEVEAKKAEQEEKIKKAIEGITEIKTEISTIKEEVNKITQELEQKGEKEQLVLRKEIETIKEELVRANTRKEVCITELEKIKQRKQQLEQNKGESETKVKELKQQKSNWEAQVQKLKKEEEECQKRLGQIKQKLGIGESSSIDALEQAIEQQELQKARLQERKQELIRRKDQLEFQLKAIEEKLNTISGKGRSKEVEELKQRKEKLKELILKVSKTANEDSVLAAQLARARQNYAFAQENSAKLNGRRLGILERVSADHAVQKILELKKRMPGIMGTVAELGQVETKYATALEVAAGPRLRSIVVDTDITAQKCIEFLKEQRLGVATFLPINKLKARNVEDDVKTVLKDKAVQGLAIDLVKYQPELKNVFLYVLGSTVIIESIEHARRLGIGRARMVTMDGDLIEPSGAMIGGSRSQKAGVGFKEKEVEENLEQAEGEKSQLQTLIMHLEQKRVEGETNLTQLRQQKAGEEGEILKLERALNVDGTDVAAIQQEQNNLTEEKRKVDKELSGLAIDLEKQEKDWDNLKEQRQKWKESLLNQGANEQITSIETQQSKIREQMSEAITNFRSADAQVQSVLLPEQERVEKIVKEMAKEFEAFQKESQELKDVVKKREQELHEKAKQEEKFYSNFRELANKRTKISEKMQQKETVIAREEEKKNALEQRLNNIVVDRAKLVAEMEVAELEFNKYPNPTIRRGIAFDDLKVRINQNEKELQIIGNVNWRALEVYTQIQDEYGKLTNKTEKIKQEKDDVLIVLNEIETQKKAIFMKTYDKVVTAFKRIFSELNTKGEVHVELEDPENPFNGGLNIQVRVTGNKLLDMKSLSGGEKTMATLALIFAIQEYAPSPFYLLDEVDAALDKRNSQLLSELIQKYADRAQYIVISHNDALINEAEYIYGVSMQEGVSKVISLRV